jgi:hypothetical protein
MRVIKLREALQVDFAAGRHSRLDARFFGNIPGLRKKRRRFPHIGAGTQGSSAATRAWSGKF